MAPRAEYESQDIVLEKKKQKKKTTGEWVSPPVGFFTGECQKLCTTKIMWQPARSQVFRQLNFSNIRWEKVTEVLIQRFEDNYPANLTLQKSHYNCKITEGWGVRR